MTVEERADLLSHRLVGHVGPVGKARWIQDVAVGVDLGFVEDAQGAALPAASAEHHRSAAVMGEQILHRAHQARTVWFDGDVWEVAAVDGAVGEVANGPGGLVCELDSSLADWLIFICLIKSIKL